MLHVLLHRDIVYPWPQQWVEEFHPLVPHMEDEGLAEEQMPQTEAGSHTPEVKQVPAVACEKILYNGDDGSDDALELVGRCGQAT